MKKIKFVQLESSAFLTDSDFQTMNAEERGLYCTLIFYLYCNNGKCRPEPEFLQRLCNCSDFKSSWKKIKEKFLSRNNFIEHKRVNKELTKARKFAQAARTSGLKGAKKRWGSHSSPNGDPIAKQSKGNVIEEERKNTSYPNTKELPVRSANTLRAPLKQSRSLMYYEAITEILTPRNQSDRTCFRNVTNWLSEEIIQERFNCEIFDRVLGYAGEAKNGRNPAAVFMALMKKELGYRGKKL